MVARRLVLVEVFGADAQVEGLVGLFLSRTLLEAWTLAPQPQLHYFLKLVIADAFAADLDNPLHVAALRTNQAPCYLKLLVVVNLNVKSAGVLDVLILCSSSLLGLSFVWGVLLLLLLLARIDILVSKLCHLLLVGQVRLVDGRCLGLVAFTTIGVWLRASIVQQTYATSSTIVELFIIGR